MDLQYIVATNNTQYNERMKTYLEQNATKSNFDRSSILKTNKNNNGIMCRDEIENSYIRNSIKKSYTFIVYCSNDDTTIITGICVFRVYKEYIYVYLLCTSSEGGIGKRLLNLLCKFAEKNNILVILNPIESAKTFYQKMKFTENMVYPGSLFWYPSVKSKNNLSVRKLSIKHKR